MLSGESKVDKSLGITFHHSIKVINQKGEKEIKNLKNIKKKTPEKLLLTCGMCSYFFSSEFLIIFLILSNYADICKRCHEGNKVFCYSLLSTLPTKDI